MRRVWGGAVLLAAAFAVGRDGGRSGVDADTTWASAPWLETEIVEPIFDGRALRFRLRLTSRKNGVLVDARFTHFWKLAHVEAVRRCDTNEAVPIMVPSPGDLLPPKAGDVVLLDDGDVLERRVGLLPVLTADKAPIEGCVVIQVMLRQPNDAPMRIELLRRHEVRVERGKPSLRP